jgi:hypothetical protein
MSAAQLKTLVRDRSATTTPLGVGFPSEVTMDEYLSTLFVRMTADQLKALFRDGSATTTPPGVGFLSEVTMDQYLSTLLRLEEEVQWRKELEKVNVRLRLALADAQKRCQTRSPSASTSQLGARRVGSDLAR